MTESEMGNTMEETGDKQGNPTKTSSETYQHLFSEAPVMYVVTQNRGETPVIVECNKRLLNTLGYRKNELVNNPLSEIYSPQSREKLFESGTDTEVTAEERQLVTKEGNVIPTLLNSVQKTNSGGEVVGWLRIYLDISERKESQIKLKRQMSRMETTHRYAHNLAGCNTEREVYSLAIEAVNQILDSDICSVNILEGEELVPKATSSGIPLTEGGTRISIEEGVAGKTHKNQESQLIEDIERKGLSIAGEGYKSAISVPIGEIGVFQAASRKKEFKEADLDLAELLMTHVYEALNRIRSEQEVKVRDRFVSTLVRNIPGMIYRCKNDRDWTMEFVSEGSKDLLGYEPSDFVENRNLAYGELIYPEDRDDVWEKVQNALEKREPFELVYRVETASGERKWVWEKGRGVYSLDNEVRAIEGFITDITERKTQKQRLEVLNRVLRHNLRNDLNVSIGRAQILRKRLKKLDFDDEETKEKFMEDVNQIVEKSNKVVDLGNKAREVERLLKYDEEVMVELDLVESVRRELQVLEERENVEVSKDFPEEARVRADRGIDSVIEEIFENGVKHNNSESPEIDVSITEDDNEYILEIRDNGPGIPQHERKVLIEGSETDLQHGSGLGLWLVNWVVSKSNGELSFEDNHPRGSVVRIRLKKAENGEE